MRKRMIISTVSMILFCAGLICRLGYIALGTTYTVQEGFHAYSLSIDTVEPYIYDCKGVKLTNNIKQYCAVLKPDEATLNVLSSVVEAKDLESVVEKMQSGIPFLYYSDSPIYATESIPVFETYTSGSSCQQLLSRQSSGLLSCLPTSIGNKKISFSVDAKGRFLTGDSGTVTENHYQSMQGLKLTLNSDVQEILYNSCDSLNSGCALVMDIDSASLLACVSKPDNTYLNKIFSSYSVGSVFKIVVALSALENGVDPDYRCGSSVTVGDTTYSCYKNKKHGSQHLKQALANSCNCYFVNLALELGAEKISQTAKELGFGEETVIYQNKKIRNAHFPSEQDLTSKGELALLGFGQGKLTATPILFGSLLCTIANGGTKDTVKIVMSEVAANGRETPVIYPKGKRVTEKKNAVSLLNDLRYVVTNGSASSADYKNAAAGKTATAQTGQYRGEEELLTTWFAGVYPYPDPKYAIVIVCEEGTGGASDCCPIFRTVVENLDKL